MLWMATLNPGRKTRRGRRRRRALTPWQRMVRKHGGVMQAVRARRGRKRRGRRRNPFVTAPGATGAFVANATRRRRRRKISKRRSAFSRRLLRGRSRRHSRRRPKMARVRRRRRRTPPRGRGGRFVSRRRGGRRRRRYHRNAVVPVSWNAPRRRRRRRNPLWRSRRSGRYRGRAPGRRLHRIRGGVGWHNPRRRRRYRRNSVLPISWNPLSLLGGRGGFGDPIGGILSRVKSMIDVGFWTETGLPAAGGFFGSKAVGGIVYGLVGEKLLGIKSTDAAAPFVRMGSDALGGAALAWGVTRFVGKKQGDMVWLGTVVNVAFSLLRQLLGGTEIGRVIGLSGLGDGLSERMKEAVARRVEAELSGYGNGMGHYLTEDYTGRRQMMGEFLTDRAARLHPGYSATPRADLKEYDVANSETSL